VFVQLLTVNIEKMSEDVTLGIVTAISGIFIGFFGNYFIARFNARKELKKSISADRAEHYLKLWKLCNRDIRSEKKQIERLEKLKNWYDTGGGLLLPFKATDRFIGAMNILEKSSEHKLTNTELKTLENDLSWLRTEMKYEVGSYSRKEANRILPNIKNNN